MDSPGGANTTLGTLAKGAKTVAQDATQAMKKQAEDFLKTPDGAVLIALLPMDLLLDPVYKAINNAKDTIVSKYASFDANKQQQIKVGLANLASAIASVQSELKIAQGGARRRRTRRSSKSSKKSRKSTCGGARRRRSRKGSKKSRK